VTGLSQPANNASGPAGFVQAIQKGGRYKSANLKKAMSVSQNQSQRERESSTLILYIHSADYHEWLLGCGDPPGSEQNSSKNLNAVSRITSPNHQTPYLVSISPSLPSSLLLRQLVQHLDSAEPPELALRNLGSFFDFIPSRLGSCAALDHAVECICNAYSATLRSDGSMVHQDRRQYYRALRSLRQTCQDNRLALTDNVLCAASLLTWYEVSDYIFGRGILS
jgi:hypothetical protein